jgi:hypothetical protein
MSATKSRVSRGRGLDIPRVPRPVALGALRGEVRRHEGQRQRGTDVARGGAALKAVETACGAARSARPAGGRVEAHRRGHHGGEGGAEAHRGHLW